MKKIIFFLCLLMPEVALANIMNSCWMGKNNNNYKVTLVDGIFKNGKKGTEVSFNYKGAYDFYQVDCQVVPRTYSYNAGWKSVMNIPQSESGGKYYKINDDVDVKVDLLTHLWGSSVLHTAPSSGFLYYANGDQISANQKYVFNSSGIIGSDASTTVTLRLRRDVIGGTLVIPAGLLLFTGYKSYGAQTNDPAITITLAGQYIPIPVNCKINNGSNINIDFGDIDSTRLTRDGSSYIKTVALNYSCNTAISQNIAITLIADTAAFSSDFIATSKSNSVGIQMKHKGEIVKPNQKFNSVLVGGKGQDEITVAPVKNSTENDLEGNFTASATLIMSLQ